MTVAKFDPNLTVQQYAALSEADKKVWNKKLIEHWSEGGQRRLQWDYERCGSYENVAWGE